MVRFPEIQNLFFRKMLPEMIQVCGWSNMMRWIQDFEARESIILTFCLQYYQHDKTLRKPGIFFRGKKVTGSRYGCFFGWTHFVDGTGH